MKLHTSFLSLCLLAACLLSGCVGDNWEFNPTAKDAPLNQGTNAPKR